MTEEEIAHEAKRRKAETRDVVTSWVLALWALGTGIYLTGGGAKHLTSPAYTYLLDIVGHDYHTVGVILLCAAVVNIVGVGTNHPLTLATGAILVGIWLGVISVCMGWASITVPDGGNLNWTTASGLSLCFFIRAYNKINPPKLPPIAAMIAMSLMLLP